MTTIEKTEVLKKIAELVLVVNAIEKDFGTQYDLLHHCEKMIAMVQKAGTKAR